MPNAPRHALTKKAKKQDIKEVRFFWTDCDPRQGEPLSDEQERIRNLFGKNMPPGVPQPTALIFSGNGYQAVWKLESPIAINGNETLAEEAERFNKKLEILLLGRRLQQRRSHSPFAVYVEHSDQGEKGEGSRAGRGIFGRMRSDAASREVRIQEGTAQERCGSRIWRRACQSVVGTVAPCGLGEGPTVGREPADEDAVRPRLRCLTIRTTIPRSRKL